MHYFNIRFSCLIWRTRDPFGELQNMHGDFPIRVGDETFGSSEALYQAQRFEIGSQAYEAVKAVRSPYRSKETAYRYIDDTRPDWETVRLDVMRWVVGLKYQQHRVVLDAVLDATQGRAIVEKSRKDQFWGAIPSPQPDILVGMNHLGSIWMNIRDGR